MADSEVHIGENSREHVAYVMTREILISVEGRQLSKIDRKLYLDTYAECLKATFGHRNFD